MNHPTTGRGPSPAFLHTAYPPDPGVKIQRWILEDPTQLRPLRDDLQTIVSGHVAPHLADDGILAENLVLVATELASNAFKHATPPPIVLLCHAAGSLILDVADHDPLTEPEYVTESGHRGHGGRGLHLVRRLATDIGWYATVKTKHVWARFAFP